MSLLSVPVRIVRCATVAALVVVGASCTSDGAAGGGTASALAKPDKNAISTPAPD